MSSLIVEVSTIDAIQKHPNADALDLAVIKGWQCVTAKELTVLPGAKCTIKDGGAYGLITVQGKGRINGQLLSSPNLIRFHELTDDEVFVVDVAARAGVTFENTSKTEPLVMLRYFGPEVNPQAPVIKYKGGVKL